MNKKFTEILLSEDGNIIRRNVIEESVVFGDDVIASLYSGIVTKIPKAFALNGVGIAGVACSNPTDFYCTLRISSLPLKAPFKAKDGILHPCFSMSKEPIIPLAWNVPENMKLVLLVFIKKAVNPPLGIQDQWLFALDGDNRCYRLPLGNLYDDARLCNGEFKMGHATIQDAMGAEWEQLVKGQWNGDLDHNPDETAKLFRFKAKNDGFEQIEPEAPWQGLCMKINPPNLKYVAL